MSLVPPFARDPLTFLAFREANYDRCKRFHKKGVYSWSTLEWMGAAAGELGEAANIAKKIKRLDDGTCSMAEKSKGLTREQLVEELKTEIAGAVAYLDLAAAAEQIDLGEAVREEFNRISERQGTPERLEVADAQSNPA